ncbi:MAG TPA: biotin/lipoyl-containing protein, partial [Patescibacteria group bacterium]|nr:biotin/lipoyl-containing protein [Patescibacteria group bacterium]
MPALGMAQETGKLVRWLKAQGDQVVKGEPLMEVETDKAAVEVEAPASGTLAAVTAAEGEDVAVGQPIAWILGPGESLADAERSMRRPGVTHAAPAQPAPRVEPAEVSPMPGSGRPAASPKARRLAAERGVDLSTVA